MQRGVDIGENNHQNEHQKQRDRKRDDSSKVHCPREKTWFAVESCPAVGAFIVHLHPMPEHDSLAALWAALVRNRFDVSRFVWLAHLKNICFWFTVRSTIVADSSLLQWSGSILVAVGPVIMQFRLQASKSPSFGWQEDTATSAPMRTDFFHQCQPTAKLRSEQPRWRGHRMVAGSSIVCNRLLPPHKLSALLSMEQPYATPDRNCNSYRARHVHYSTGHLLGTTFDVSYPQWKRPPFQQRNSERSHRKTIG